MFSYNLTCFKGKTKTLPFKYVFFGMWVHIVINFVQINTTKLNVKISCTMGTFPVLILFTLKVLLRLRIDGLLDQKKKLRRSDFEWPVCRKNNSCVYPSIFSV